VGHEILCDLKTDSLISPGDQGDGFVLHSHLLISSNCWSTRRTALVYQRGTTFRI
jgi:hypothetical protein